MNFYILFCDRVPLTYDYSEYGGKWKMLHYYAARFFNTTLLSPYVDGETLKVALVYNGSPRPHTCQVDAPTSCMMAQTLNVGCYSWSSLTLLKMFKFGFKPQVKDYNTEDCQSDRPCA